MLKKLLKSKLNSEIYEALYNLKIFFKRAWRLIANGRKYMTRQEFFKYIYKKTRYLKFLINPSYGKKIIWIGAFPPMHSNMGDHAQTVAVEKYFKDKFPDYMVISLNRNQVSINRLKKISSILKEDDLVFIQSSGDFGSKYHDFENSYCKLRKEIVDIFNNNKVINLPTTVYYEENKRGREILNQDVAFFKNKQIIVLAREDVSASFLERHFESKSRFFPDPVFYLKPEITKKTRKGALILLRSDKESGISDRNRKKIVDISKQFVEIINDNDILKTSIPVVDIIRENYVNAICRVYQNYEFVITDRMHGMILGVISHTPCIAINGGIPHKISAYQSFLSDSVKFVDDIDDIGQAIHKIKMTAYKSTDMSCYYNELKTYIMADK